MATHVRTSTQLHRTNSFPAAWILARKLLRRTWGLLLIIACAMIAMVGLVSAIPLFSNVAIAASVQEVANVEVGGPHITVQTQSDHPTTSLVQQIGQNIQRIFSPQLSTYLDRPQLSILTPELQVLNMQTGQADKSHHISVLGYDFSQIKGDISVLQGRLPQAQSTKDAIEIAVTQPVADELGLTVGSQRTVRYPIAANSVIWKLRVVGIISPKLVTTNLWHSLLPKGNAVRDAEIQPDAQGNAFTVLASLQTIMPHISSIQVTQPSLGSIEPKSESTTMVPLSYVTNVKQEKSVIQPMHAVSPALPLNYRSGGQLFMFSLYWSYPLKIERINGTNVNALLQAYTAASAQGYDQVQQNTLDSHLISLSLLSPAIDQLRTYNSSLLAEQIIVTVFLISIFVLILYMVNILPNILIERQLATIAIARSRGATRRHIFGAFALQCLLTALVVLFAGPVCAFFLVIGIAHLLLSSADQAAIQTISGNPMHSITSVLWLALLSMVFIVVVMLLAIRRATQIDVLSFRRESARTGQVPFWKRMYLDIVLSMIVLALFSYYLFLSSRDANGVSATFGPLALIAAPALLFIVLLLFLRIVPLLLRLGIWLTSRIKGASGVLAFTQMERQPLITLRMIMILTMTMAFSVYLFSFIATQQYNTQERIRFQIGADFSGPIVSTNSQISLESLKKYYASIPGVAVATLGYTAMLTPTGYSANASFNDTSFNAVDADTYAQTAIWSPDYSSQSVSSLMSQLAAHRADASAHNVVYAVVTRDLWQNLNLSPGVTFTYPVNDSHFQHIQFVALAEANILPSSHNYADNILVDYQSYATVYAKNNAGRQLQPNYVWLAAQHIATAQEQIHRVLPALQDLSLATANAQNAPAQLAIDSTLMLGILSLLVLSIIGILLTAWLGVSQRLTGFAMLRALGLAPRQILAILVWEQGTTYGLALLLGLGIGWLLTSLIGPVYSMLNSFAFTSDYIGVPLPQHTVLPYAWIGLLCALFVIICSLTLLFTARYASRPAMSQALRLNED